MNRLLWFIGLGSICLVGCTEIDNVEIGGAGEGESCNQISDCDAGFTCEDDRCVAVPPISTGPQRGDPCTSTADCGAVLFCGTQGVCSVSEGALAGAPCGLSIDCQAPLVCHGDDLVCVDPQDYPDGKGVADFGEACASFTDCRRPYMCSIADAQNAKCDKVPFFPGPDCTLTEMEIGAFRVYYELPPSTIDPEQPFEFYRLPFPNDVRLVDGSISLSGHPSPGEVMGIDVAGEYIRSIEQIADGFAINGPVFFRLTDFPSRASICLDPGSKYDLDGLAEFCPDNGPATVYLVDIDPQSPDYNSHFPLQLALFKGRSQYLCQHTIGVAPLDGQPLRPRTTYAVIITSGLRALRDVAPVQDQDFARVIAGDSDLSPAVLDATDPLRAWIADQGIDPNTLAAATSFTTGDPATIGADLYDAVTALPQPGFETDAFSCEAQPAGIHPCHGRSLLNPGTEIEGRGCPSVGSTFFTEIHGSYRAPVFQQGTRPYLTSDFLGDTNSGSMNLDPATGKPVPYAEESICYTLTIPKNVTMPQAPDGNGWPVLIYSHGTNGNYRGFVDKELTEQLSDAGFAIIGIDNVMHGPRQDPSSDYDMWAADLWNVDQPGNLYFNVINPKAARDNTLQGAVDLFYLTRLVAGDAPVVAGVDIQFDPDNIFFLGHSQGTTIAPPYLVHETQLKGAALSGAGAELALSILNKTEPVNIADAVGTMFGDKGLSRVHPMMGLLAIMFGPADSVAYADKFVLNPPRLARPLIMFSGMTDSYTPYPTQEALIRAMGVPLVAPVVMSLEGVPEVNPPLTDAQVLGVQSGVAAGALQFAPQGSGSGQDDGHFVLFNYAEARAAMVNFLTTSVDEAQPTEIDR